MLDGAVGYYCPAVYYEGAVDAMTFDGCYAV